MSLNQRINLGIMFGGRSAEHEISILTALQAITALDTTRYNVVPIYIDTKGSWYTGELLLNKKVYRDFEKAKEYLQEVILLPKPGQEGLCCISPEGQILTEKRVPIDVYFLTFHGQYGEDGCMQGLLELADVVYTGSNVGASSLAMHKYRCKMYLKAHDIPTLPALVVSKHEVQQNFLTIIDQILATDGLQAFPLFVKPCNLGSSIGISAVQNRQELQNALAKVFMYDEEALIEPCVVDLMEINVSVLEGSPPIASVVEIPVATGQVLTYEDKYLRGGKKTSSSGMSSLSRVIDPEHLDASLKDEITQYALKAFKLIGSCGVSRFDFIFDKKTAKIYFNEVNSIPGSLSFYLWEKSRPMQLYTHLIDRLVERAIQRKAAHLSLKKNLGFKALR